MPYNLVNTIQIDLKKALEVEAKCAEVTRDRERAEQLEAAIKSDRRREAHVKRLDRARINKWAPKKKVKL